MTRVWEANFGFFFAVIVKDCVFLYMDYIYESMDRILQQRDPVYIEISKN